MTQTLWFSSGSGLCEEWIFNSCEELLFSFGSTSIHVFIYQALCFEHCSRYWENSERQDQGSTLKKLNFSLVRRDNK